MLRQTFLAISVIITLGAVEMLLGCRSATTTPEPTTSPEPTSLSEVVTPSYITSTVVTKPITDTNKESEPISKSLPTPTLAPTLARPKPSVAKKILDLHYVMPAEPGPPPPCGVNSDHAEPTIVNETTFFPKQMWPSSRLSPFCVCGYKENEIVTISVINPLDEVLLRQETVVEPALSLGSRTPLIYCQVIHEISTLEFLLSDPVGEYTVEILSQNARLAYNFDLISFPGPVMYYSDREGGYVLAGFDPFEKVLILGYVIEDWEHGRLTGEHELTLDQNGIGLWTKYDPETAFFYIVREDLDLIFTLTAEEKQSGPGTSPPLDYDKIIELDPPRAKYAYYQRASEYASDDPIADLTEAIKIDPSYLPAYEARARYYEWQDNYDRAIADYSKMIELDPANLSAYEERVRLYEEQNNFDRAIADYNEMIRFDPKAEYYYDRARLYDHQGDIDQARADFIKAIELDKYTSYGTINDYTRTVELAPEFALAYYWRGRAYRSQGSDEQAIADFTRAISFNPDLIELYRERARLYEKQGNYHLAIADHSKIIELASNDLLAYKERARLYEEQRDYDLAIEDYSKITEFTPNDLVAYRQQIRLYKKQGKYEQTIAVYGNILKRFPHYLPAYYERGLLHEKQGNNDQALADYSKIIEDAPENSAIAYYARGRIYEKQGSYKIAAIDYNKVIEIAAPYEPIADYARGRLYAGQGDYNQAIVTFTKAVEYDDGRYGTIADYNKVIGLIPDYLPAYERRAHLYEEHGNYELAIADYSEAIKLDPKVTYYFARARLYDYQGNIDRARDDFIKAIELDENKYYPSGTIDDYNRAIELAPEFALAYFRRGIAYRRQGDYDRAIADFARVIEYAPDTIEAYEERASLYESRSNNNLAIADYSKMIELNPDYLPAYEKRAYLYEEQGNYDLAIADYSRMILLNPDYFPTYEKRAHLYIEQGNYELAVTDFSKGSELYPESANYNNLTCWFGSLLGYAAEVINTCEKAVTLDSENGAIRDARGLARALIGDYEGAIEDFEFYVEWSKQSGSNARNVSWRETWITELKSGRNPFDETTLEELRNE